jgi:two-component system osmolarity sensor histidine kinase EnvZ
VNTARPRFRFDSLFGLTSLTIALTLLAFALISAGATVYFVVLPMAKRSAEDLAAEIATAAVALQWMPARERAPFREQLMHDHGIVVADRLPATSPLASNELPYFREALQKHSLHEFNIEESVNNSQIWVDIQAGDKSYWLGFDSGRLGTNPPLALVLVLGGGALLTLAVSLFVVRKITRHLNIFSAAARKIGQGRLSAEVSTSGPAEISALAEAFNQMSANLHRMAENRTVMIAGLSHDLRTPLTRLGLAVEMLDESADQELLTRIRRNLGAMNNLITEFLLFSRGMERINPVRLRLWEILESLIIDLEADGVDVRLNRCDNPATYVADREVLERILLNLLKNAVQYGQGVPVDVDLHCSDDGGVVDIMDRGPGIPPDEVESAFQPFQRLETGQKLRASGSGLGLAIARQLADRHGWTIELVPREGGGTIARVVLPPAA